MRACMIMSELTQIRQMFPVLSRKVHGKNLVYFDNAATSQRPQSVVDLWTRISSYSNANIHRAVHCLADEATTEYEQTRDVVREFINAGRREEIIFTSGATASINLVAFSFGEAFVGEDDEVIVTEAEHHSNIVPWQMMCLRKGASLKVLPVDDHGHLVVDALEELITDRTRILALTHISNVLGIVNPVKEVIANVIWREFPCLWTVLRGLCTAGWMARDWVVISMHFPGIRCMRPQGPECFTARRNILT